MCIKIRITNIKNISEKCTENVLKISHKLKMIPNIKIRGIKILGDRLADRASVAQSRFGNGIPSAGAKGLAPQDAHDGEDRADDRPSLLKRLNGVGRAGRRKAAGRLLFEGGKILLVKPNGQNEQPFHVAAPSVSAFFCESISRREKPRRSSRAISVDLAERIPSRGLITIRKPVFSSGSTAR